MGTGARKERAAFAWAALGAPLGWSLPRAFLATAVQEAYGDSA